MAQGKNLCPEDEENDVKSCNIQEALHACCCSAHGEKKIEALADFVVIFGVLPGFCSNSIGGSGN